MQKHKERLDLLLVERGLASSREKAKALIMAGQVYVAGQREDKAGMLVEEEAEVLVRGPVLPYVSRGGLKLEKAIKTFGITLEGYICMDAGASTGGFTDCMLQKGAAKVYAIDVGYGQLAWKLRQDERVVVLEKTNVRYLDEEKVPDLCDFASADLSFISLTKVLLPIASRIREGGEMVCLVKPQFEAGKEQVGKNGVVRSATVHKAVCLSVLTFAQEHGFGVSGLDYSPIKGPKGNVEFLAYLIKNGASLGESQLSTLIDGVLSSVSF